MKASTDRTWRMSDHYPLVASWRLPRWDIQIFCWPSPSCIGSQQCIPLWPSHLRTYTEWSEAARCWLSEAFQTHIEPKNILTTSLFSPKNNPHDVVYERLCALMRAVKHAGPTPTREQHESIQRKLVQLCIDPDSDLQNLQELVQE